MAEMEEFVKDVTAITVTLTIENSKVKSRSPF
jgi:hypothetical protein